MNRDRKLLVITYHFPPDGAVGGLRWAGLSKYLARLGWEVHVITAAHQSAAPEEPGVTVHTVRPLKTLDDAYNAIRSRLRRTTPDAPPPAAGSSHGEEGGSASGLMHVLRREIAYALSIPDDSRGWVLRAAWTARSLLRRHDFTCLVTSGPPHGAHVAGALARGDVPLVLDFRDPWRHQVQVYRNKDLMPSRLNRWVEPRLRRFTERAASAIVANTRDFVRDLAAETPGTPVHWLPNGIDPERLPEGEARPEGRAVSHVGSLYMGRDLGPVLRALRRVRDRNSGGAAGELRLRLAGPMDDGHRARFLDQLEETGVEDQVDVLGVVPGERALEVLRSSRLALVLAQDQKLQVPAKIYESIALGVPTLVISERDSASFQEALRMGAHAREPADVDGIADVLEETALGPWPGRFSPREPIDYGAIAVRMEELLDRVARSGADAEPGMRDRAAGSGLRMQGRAGGRPGPSGPPP